MAASPTGTPVRYHDMDALRAVAMILGIALHGALSFVPFPWGVQDNEQHEAFGTFFYVVHGFRMPVFFVMSGFFTAMLWRRRGLIYTFRQRFLRVFLPCMVGIFTICPLNDWVGGVVQRTYDLTGLARQGDLEGVKGLLAEGIDPNELAEDKTSALHWAAVQGHQEIVAALLDAGADPDIRSEDRDTPLHWTAFFGEPEMVKLLLKSGADPNARNLKGESPIDTVSYPWNDEIAGIAKYYAGIMRLDIDLEQLQEDRPAVIAALKAAGAEGGGGIEAKAIEEGDKDETSGSWIEDLMFTPVFHHLWFLWFLCLLVAVFGIYALCADYVGLKRLPGWMVVSPLRYLWLLPLTLLPQLMMHDGGEHQGFGPDTSLGWLPFPHLFFYYAIFFFFGAFYHDCGDKERRMGSSWWLTLPVALLVVFPLGMELSVGSPSGQETVSGSGELSEAAKEGDLKEVKELLADDEDPNELAEDKTSALHWAAVKGYQEIVAALLDAGADPDIRSEDGSTPLHWTAFFGEPEMTELLLESGANPDVKNDRGESPLDTVIGPWNEEREGLTKFFGGLMGLDVDLEQIQEVRPAVITLLEEASEQRHFIRASLQVLFVWLMIFGLMGLFQKLFRRESRVMRYISDSSYWLYLAHLPLILLAQWYVKDWALSPFIKFPLMCGVVTGLLLLSYHFLVRYTPIGTFLNGRRERPAQASVAAD